MAKRTNAPAGITPKFTFEVRPGVPANKKIVPETEWTPLIDDLLDTIDQNYERLILRFESTDVIDNQILPLGQYVDFGNTNYRVITSYNVGTPKTFDPAKFRAVGGGPEFKTWYVDVTATSGGDGSPQNKFNDIQDAIDAAVSDDLITVGFGNYTTALNTGGKNLKIQGINAEETTIGAVLTHNSGTLILYDLEVNDIAGTGDVFANNCKINAATGTKGSFVSGNNSVIVISANINAAVISMSGGRIEGNVTASVAVFINNAHVIGGVTVSADVFTSIIVSSDIDGDINITGDLDFFNSTYSGIFNVVGTLNKRKQFPDFGSPAIKTISAGIIAVGADRNIVVAAETGVADDLIEITGLNVGEEVWVRADTGDTITLKHNDAGATVKILIQDDADFVADEQHPLKLGLVATNQLAQVFDEVGAGGGGGAPDFGLPVIKTLSTGVAVASINRNLVIAAESGTADDMIELTGLAVGEKVLLRADTGDTITVKHNDAGATVKILLQDDSDFILDEQHALALVLIATNQLVPDNITESVTKKFLDSTDDTQVIAKNKRFSGQARSTPASNKTFTATPTFDMDDGNYQKMILTGNVTSLTLSNKENGSAYVVILEIDGSARTIATPDSTWGTKTDNSADFLETANAINTVNIMVDPDGKTRFTIETET